MAKVRRKSKKKPEAQDELVRDMESMIDDLLVRGMIQKARILNNKVGDMEGSLELCEKILKLSPDNRDALLLKAGTLGHLERIREEADVMAKIVRLYPENAEVHYLLAIRLLSMGKDDEALRYIDMSLERDENFNNLIGGWNKG